MAGYEAVRRAVSDEIARPGVTRRGFLGGMGAIGTGLALAACGASGSSSVSGSPVAATKLPFALRAGTPKRGGTLTIGIPGGGSAETLWPGGDQVYSDYVRAYNLYSMLMYPGINVTPIEPGLALSAEPNSDATVWIFKLRDGVEWHDGKPFTSQDVVYNLQTVWPDPKLNLGAGLVAGLVDLPNVKAVDKLTVRVPLTRPIAQFATLLIYVNSQVVQDGATPQSTAAKPIGTGPFKYVSFEAGRQSVFEANPNYWEHGKPYVDRLVIDSSFSENTALVNALTSGQINVWPSMDPVSAREHLATKDFQIIQSELAANVAMIAMRVDKGPFVDSRIREAMKLACDRQALVDGALSGFGTPGNDLISVGSQWFASNIKPQYDPDKARSLMRAAGAANETFVLDTIPLGGSWDSAATLFAQQAKAAGINIKVQEQSVSVAFTPAGGVYEYPFRQNVSAPIGVSLTASYDLFLSKNAPFPDTHWGQQKDGGAQAQALLNRAIEATDPQQAADLWRQVQVLQASQGGYICWANMPFLDAAANNVRGLRSGAAMTFNNARMCDGWID
jgi:peptide/nickel transport system substrate-binding protein